MGDWRIEDRDIIETDEPVHSARVELVSGAVDVVSTDGPTRVEVEVISGPPVIVSLSNGELRVRYEKNSWIGLPAWTGGRRREVRVSVAVPADTRVTLGVVDAGVTVAGFTSPAAVDTVSGTAVLDDLGDGVKGSTVSGDLQLRGVRGAVELDSVSGNLTLVDGHMTRLRADSVSGDITLDLHPHPGDAAEVALNSVSGDLLVRTPVAALGRVRMSSTSGKIDATAGLLEIRRSPGSKRAQCNGDGDTAIEVSTVSGRILLVDQNDPES